MHRKPRLNPFGRELIVTRLEAGWPAAVLAEQMNVSRATVHKWWRRFKAEGWAGLDDRTSRPHGSPRRLTELEEAPILAFRKERKLGPHRIAALTGRPRSTVYAVLRRHGLHRLDWMERTTGVVVRRYERELPGELVHVDVKKLGRIPEGGGHRMYGRQARPDRYRAMGYDYVHSLVDDHSRLAYSEVLPDEQGSTCAAFIRRAGRFLAGHGIQIQAVMTDNALAYRNSKDFRAALGELNAKHLFTPPYTPRINGKVERFNRTLLDEWAYVRPYVNNAERVDLLNDWLHRYNYHRSHTALYGRSPMDRVNNLSGNYS